MSLGKYSPTVNYAYRKNQQWFSAYAGNKQYDPDGYDSYGYNAQNVDRAGYREDQYSYWGFNQVGEPRGPDLYDDVAADWQFDGTKPVKVTVNVNV